MAMQIHEWLREHRINEIEYVLPDLSGVARGKTIPKGQFATAPDIRLPSLLLLRTVTGEALEYSVPDIAEPDMLIKPDYLSLRLVPWSSEPTAQFLCDCYRADGSPIDYAPRAVLKRVLALYEAEGWQPVVAPELEFYLVAPNTDPDVPLAPPVGRTGRVEFGSCSYAVDAANEFDPFFEDVYDHCQAQGLGVDTLIHEAGSAQMGINLRHGEPLALADQIFLFKRTVRATALRHRLLATFMAKPMEGEPGSAMHLHQSVLDKNSGCNLFSRRDGKPSARFQHFIGGLQTFLPHAMLFFAPYVNSFRRLAHPTTAPANLAWAYDSRAAAFRVPHADPDNRRVENRVPGADANPYLAIAATLACGYLGMKRRIKCSEPLPKSTCAFSPLFPNNWLIALDKLTECQPLADILGPRFISLFIELKRQESLEFFRVISPWERKHLLLHV